MRILVLTQVLPFPLDAGPKVRAYYTLRHLAGRGHKVTLVSFVRTSDTPVAVEHLQSFCERVITVPMPRARWRDAAALVCSLVTGEPLLIARDRVAAMRATLHAMAATEQFDAIHADQLWMAPYALYACSVAERQGYRPVLILDQHNAVHLIPERLGAAARNPLVRWAYQRERTRMAKFEARICLAFDDVVTVTDEDRQNLQRLFTNRHRPRFAQTIPIALDPEGVQLVRRQPGVAELLFVGGMHWPPNADGVTWFVHEVLPIVQARVPHARFTAVGKAPPRRLHALPPEAGIHLPGYVEDLQPFWEKSSAFVIPLRAGGGMRVKILDAWAQGIPVISTTIGTEGLAGLNGQNLLVADTAAEFAEAVIKVLADPGLAERLVLGGRAMLEQRYNWRTSYAAWDALYAG